MKKYGGLLSLALLVSNLHGTRIKLKDGNCVDVPDHLRVENDLGADAFIAETIGWIDGYGFVTTGHVLPRLSSYVVRNCHAKDKIMVVYDNKVFQVGYPTVQDYKNKIAYHYDVNSAITSEFTYKLSALIDAAAKKIKTDSYAFPSAARITVYEKEETWLRTR